MHDESTPQAALDQDDEAAKRDAILEELEAMLAEAAPVARPRPPSMPFRAPSRDDPDIFFDEPKLTRYDRVMADLHKAEAARDALLALPRRTDLQARHLTVLERQIAKAKTALQRAQSDISRLRDTIDEYRKTPEGKAKRNAPRRKVRAQANADLSELTPEQLAKHQKNMAADRKWCERQRKAGWSEAQIQAGLAARRIEREESATIASPNFGIV